MSSYHGGPSRILDSPCKICSGLNGKCFISSVQSSFPLMHHNNVRCGIALTGLMKAYILLDKMSCPFRSGLLPPSGRWLLALTGNVWAALRWELWSPPKCWCVYTSLHGVLFQKTENLATQMSERIFFLINLWSIDRPEIRVKNRSSLKTAVWYYNMRKFLWQI
jgi:hypothetical protein